MKICVSSYSFSQLTKTGEYNLIDCIALAKEIGCEGIEFAGINPHDGSSKEEYAAKLAEEAKKQDMEIVNYTIGADLLNGSDGNLDAEVERLKKEVDIAAVLGASGMRHDATRGYDAENRHQRGFNDALPTLIEGCRRVTEYAATKGVRTMVENHGYFCQESRRVEQLVNGVGHDNFGILVDIGNFLCADEAPELAVARLAPYAYHVHAKDFHIKSGNGLPPQNGFFKTAAGNYLRGAIIGHGEVPVLQCLSILKNAGYNGYVSIEFEGIENAKLGVQYGYNTLKYIKDFLDWQ